MSLRSAAVAASAHSPTEPPRRGRSAAWRMLWLAAVASFLTGSAAAATDPVTFTFRPDGAADATPAAAYARELWADVRTPVGTTLHLPAYYVGDGTFAVRARPDARGEYRFAGASETTGGEQTRSLAAHVVSAATVAVSAPDDVPAVERDRADPRAFVGTNGQRIVPVGANLAWPEGDCGPYYQEALAKFGSAGMNWMRVWMAHWALLNLDWRPAGRGTSPRPGELDPVVAQNWDQIVQAAVEHRVYLQIVLQHHGQYTTGANSNWAENPWNAANGGFLASPSDFFTNEQARRLTRQKYRYIVARWGWSPAIFAWELFNEVHWVDAINQEKRESVVAAWHAEMADWIRRVDPYHHLITTSTDRLDSPCYAKMDFFQPHLYSADLILGARSITPPQRGLDRPAFYGEVGDDHVEAPPEVKAAGIGIVPPAWAGLFGVGRLPAQPWVGWTILSQQRTAEIGALQRFAQGSGFAEQRGLEPFSAVVESEARMPLELRGCQVWQRRAAPELDVDLDGRLPLALADIPRIYVGWPGSVADGFPDHATYHFTAPRELRFRAQVVGLGADRAGIQFLLDGTVVAERRWAKDATDRPSAAQPAELGFEVPAGPHTLLVRNAGDGEWVDLAGIDLGMDVSALGAIGLRNAGFIAVWIWNRPAIQAVADPAPQHGVVVLDVPAGNWRVQDWDTARGQPVGAARLVRHRGGPLRLTTPTVVRHAAIVLTRTSSSADAPH